MQNGTFLGMGAGSLPDTIKESYRWQQDQTWL